MRPSSVIALVMLLALPAIAQKVVILEIDGDPQGKLRAQIEASVRSAAVVELIPLKTFKDAAAKKKLKGAAAMTPVGVTRASKLIKLDAAVGGEVLVTDDVRTVTNDQFGFGEVRELALKGLSDPYPAAPLDWSN